MKDHNERLESLELKIMYLEDSLETINKQLATVLQENKLNRNAFKHLYQQIEDTQAQPSNAQEPPPPHY